MWRATRCTSGRLRSGPMRRRIWRLFNKASRQMPLQNGGPWGPGPCYHGYPCSHGWPSLGQPFATQRVVYSLYLARICVAVLVLLVAQGARAAAA